MFQFAQQVNARVQTHNGGAVQPGGQRGRYAQALLKALVEHHANQKKRLIKKDAIASGKYQRHANA